MSSIKSLIGKLKRTFEKRALVLMYHRIAECEVDPWNLCVSRSNFEQQLQILSEGWRVIPLAQLVSELKGNKLKSKTIAITFDDGYSDNYEVARPLLKKYKLPATFFISDYNVQQQEPFWWDELEQLILYSRHVPPEFRMSFPDSEVNVDIGREAVLTDNLRKQYHSWKGTTNVPSKRCELYLQIWAKLKLMPGTEQKHYLERIRNIVSIPSGSVIPVMTKEQLADLASDSLFNIGLHTKHHVLLSAHGRDVQKEEINRNRDWLQNLTEDKIDIISYPYGGYNDNSVSVMEELGLSAGFTTDAKPVRTSSPVFKLGRCQVNNWSTFRFQKELKGWTNKS